MHEQVQEIRYEGYGPGGVAVMVDCLTGDREHSAAQLREALARFGGRLGAEGSVRYLFNPVGLLHYRPDAPVPQLRETAFNAGAEDVVSRGDGSLDVLTDPADYERVCAALKRAGLPPERAQVTLHAASVVPLEDGPAEQVARLLAALRELECVRNVYSNADIADAILARV
jgi:transcriptional/translational regulatory protein YebC/TACO1